MNNRKTFRPFGTLLALGIVAVYYLFNAPQAPREAPEPLNEIFSAYINCQSEVMIEATGMVQRILEDDNKGSRHQRFIVGLPDAQTVLVAHNIDLAPRVKNLSPGTPITIRGQYEYNSKGGVVHWTHHDPAKRHPGGWIEYRGKRYE